MKEKYLINARIVDPKNQMDEIGGLIIDSKGLIKAIGKIVKKPTKNLAKLKVRGPMLSIPVSCAIKAVPQIKVVTKAHIIEIDFFIYEFDFLVNFVHLT